MKKQFISVIIPVYKVDRFLNRCINSILNQTYSKIEIILVDDGSPDTCPEICDNWIRKDDRIKVIHKENGGLSDARNYGMGLAVGEYIGFVDSDDWIAPEMYERLYSAMNRDGADLAACAVSMVWEDGRPNELLTVKENCVLNRNEAQKALMEESKLKQPVWYKLYKAQLIKNIPFETGRYHEDVFWSYQAIGKASKVSLIDYIGYFYWQRQDSIMGGRYSLTRLDAIDAVCFRYEYIKKSFPALQDRALIAVWENCIYHGQMVLKYLSAKEEKAAFNILRTAMRDYPLAYNDYKSIKFSHKIWLTLSKKSLKLTCRIKNLLKIGL